MKLAVKERLVHRSTPRNDDINHATDGLLRVDSHEENCAECHHHHQHEEATNTRSISKELHLKHDHQCTDHNCDIHEPHGHNLLKKPKSKKTNFEFEALETLIGKSSLPQPLKEFAVNFSFLTPAILVSNIGKNLKLADTHASCLAIAAMHGINRGTSKLSRLALTLMTSGAANLAKNFGINKNIIRIIATSIIAIIEKFSNGLHSHDHSSHHHHSHDHNHDHHNHENCTHHHHHNHQHEKKDDDLFTKINKDFKTLRENLGNIKYWKELFPSLINVESKVQIISPLMNMLANKISKNSKNSFLKQLVQSVTNSIGFVISDQILKTIAKSFGENSSFASAVSSVCGCCGSTVCAAAATDAALNQSL